MSTYEEPTFDLPTIPAPLTKNDRSNDLLTSGLERLKRRQAEVLKLEEELSRARSERDATVALLLSLDESQGGPATIYGIAKALGVTRQSVMAMRDKAKRV